MKQSLFFRCIGTFKFRALAVGLGAAFLCAEQAGAQIAPSLVDSNLSVRTNVSGLVQPTTMAFIGPKDMLVLEKASGKVQRVTDGVIQPTPALDLAVNSGSERGLLGIALHPYFPTNPGVYLYWTESTTGADTTALGETPLLGNRVDRFVWNGSTLTFETNIIRLRALQEDAGQAARGNHDGGVIKFGRDRKLYIYMGDNGRRGQMQNLPDGPGCTNPPCAGIPAGNLPDDQFGGPEPDNAHLTGVILRLNDDGSTPKDNPFRRAGARRGGEAGANLQKVFAYGIRNGFGMAFDPFTGKLWEAQNGDDTFTEINLVEPGANLGWVQVMGPLSRIEQFKEIETSSNFFGLQQVRWLPTNIADSQGEALARLFWVFDRGDKFTAFLTGSQEVPAVQTEASAIAGFELEDDGSLEFELRAIRPIKGVTMAHIHLGARGQNGAVAAFLFESSTPRDFRFGERIAHGRLSDSNVIARPGFTPTIANLVDRMRQGRAYANVHTVTHPSGEVRGQIIVADRKPVSHYSDPEFSWKFEVAPAAVGFVSSRALGERYHGDMVVGAARTNLLGGNLFRFNLSDGRRKLDVDDPRLHDRVADNLAKFDITESESLLFGTGFGIGTDIQTGPNGNLYVVSLSNGEIYEVFRNSPEDDDDRSGSSSGRD